MQIRAALLAVIATLAVMSAGSLAAQSSADHLFLGDCESGSGAFVDGRLAPDGTSVRSWDRSWAPVGETVIANCSWSLSLDRDLGSVRFTVGNSAPSPEFAVLPRAVTEVEFSEPSAQGSLTASGALVVARFLHTATPLPDGTILVTGGIGDAGAPIASAEVFDPASAQSRAVGALAEARSTHRATPLADGTVLITGGFSGDTATATAEIYDPAGESFRSVGPMTAARQGHTATLLADGRVLIVGGRDGAAPLSSAEVYDPQSETFSASGDLAEPRTTHTATGLADGSVLIAGGTNDSAALASAERFDPATGGFSPAASLAVARTGHVAVLLLDGKVGVVGGAAAGIELYDPVADVFSTTGSLGIARSLLGAALLPDGGILAVGGAGFEPTVVRPVEIVNAARGQAAFGPMLTTNRWMNTTTALNDGDVLIIGGATGPSDAPLATSAVERYSPAASQTIPLGPGWNLTGWFGATPVEVATDSIAGQFETLFTWDVDLDRFRTFRPAGPAFLSDLTDLEFGDGVWVLVSDPAGALWAQPMFREAREVPLNAGFNLVLWSGPSATPIAEAVAALGDDVTAVFTWQQSEQAFRSWRRDAPAFLNSASVLNYGDGLWIQMSGSATWTQPAQR